MASPTVQLETLFRRRAVVRGISMSLLDDLSNYYRAQGISSLSFACKHLQCCKRGCSNFAESREAYVGRLYDKDRRTVPHLLFLALDPGQETGSPELRSVAGQRSYEENLDHDQLPRTHWHWTHELARTLLCQFIPGLSLQEACQYFALTLSAKCCMNNPNNQQADDIMYKN
jgi:hypothetical protein